MAKKYNLKNKKEKKEYLKQILKMAINNIKDGDILTYKDISERLDDEFIESRTTRANRIKLWNKHCFSIENVSGSHKYKISNINVIPTPIEDGRDGNSPFLKYTYPLMLNYLMKNPRGSVDVTRTKLMNEIGFVNNKWSEAYEIEKNRDILATYSNYNVTMMDIWDIIDNAGNSFKHILYNTLNHLANMTDEYGADPGLSLIKIKYGYTFARNGYYNRAEKEANPKKYEVIPEPSFLLMSARGLINPNDYSLQMIHTDATTDEINMIPEIRREVLDDNGIDSFKDIKKENRMSVLNDMRESVCSYFGCKYYYEKYHITYNIESVKKAYNSQKDAKTLVKEFNEIIALNQSNNANKRMINAYKIVDEDANLTIISTTEDRTNIKKLIESDKELSKGSKMALVRTNPHFMDFNDVVIDKYIIRGDTSIRDMRKKNNVSIQIIEYDIEDLSIMEDYLS